jgi:hypothetical protein
MSSISDGKVLVCSLWERTSAKGNTYLSGFLGKARIIGFRGEPTADGTLTWNIYLQPGKEQEEASTSRVPRSTAGSRRQPRSQEQAAGEPFFDDPVDDIGRDR